MDELKHKLSQQIATRLQLAEQLEKQVDALTAMMQNYLDSSSDINDTARQLGGINAGMLPIRHHLFGYVCHRLGQLFPLDMPKARKEHRRPLLALEGSYLTKLLTDLGEGA